MNASHPFSSQREFPISVCQKFQDDLDPRLITGFRWFFLDHSVVQSLASTHQRKILQQMLSAAQQAEDKYASTQRNAREAIGMSQAFPIGAASGGSPHAPAFPSQAETTLNRYAAGGGGYSTDGGSRATDRSGGRGPPRTWNCFGCGGPHPYSEYKDGQHIIICPNKDTPGVREHATKNIEKMHKNRKKKHTQNQKRKNLGTANYADFDEAGKQRIRHWRTRSERERERNVVRYRTRILCPKRGPRTRTRWRWRQDFRGRCYCPRCYHASQASDVDLNSKQFAPYPHQVW